MSRSQPADPQLLVVDPNGSMRNVPRSSLVNELRPNDLLIANDAATIPASLTGLHVRTGQDVEIRLAGRSSLSMDAVDEFLAIAFGTGDYHTRTEDRAAPPLMQIGDLIALGPLRATVLRRHEKPRLITIRFEGTPDTIWAGLALHGKPIQYAHAPDPFTLWDVWTPIAATPAAFEPPSAGFALDWSTLAALRTRSVGFATLTLAAGISSTGDAELDEHLPFDEPYELPAATVLAVGRARERGGRVIAIGTTVTRALEHAAALHGTVRAGSGIATQHLGPQSTLRVVDAILTGVHEVDSSHFSLMRAFAPDDVLRRMNALVRRYGLRAHEFGDSILLARQRRPVAIWRDERATHLIRGSATATSNAGPPHRFSIPSV